MLRCSFVLGVCVCVCMLCTEYFRMCVVYSVQYGSTVATLPFTEYTCLQQEELSDHEGLPAKQ